MDRVRRLIVLAGYVQGPRVTSRLRQMWAKLRNPLADIRFGAGCRLGPGFSIRAPWGGEFHCGDNTEFRRGFTAELEGSESRLEVGSNCSFTYGVLIQCGRSISLGDRVMIGQAAQLVDGNHRFRDLDLPAVDQGYDFRPIRIDDSVMVLSKCTIVAGIGERAVVGANSVVTQEIPAHSVAVGAPARVVDYFGPERSSRSDRSGTTASAREDPASSQAPRK